MSRPNKQEVQRRFNEYYKICKQYNITVLRKPLRLSDKVKHKCHCGKVWICNPTKVMQKPRCNLCAIREVARKSSLRMMGSTPGNAITEKDFKQKLKESGSTKKLLGTYTGMLVPTEFECSVCGTIEISYPSNVLRFGCSTCKRTKKKTTSEHSKEIKSLNISLLSEYKGAHLDCRYLCNNCGFVWKFKPTNILKVDRNPCPSCSPKYNSAIHTFTHKGYFFKVRSKGELEVLKHLLKFFKASDIKADLTQGTPTIRLPDNRIHRPDFYVESQNTLIEVKSDYTIGITDKNTGRGKRIFHSVVNNRRYAVQQGYKYELIVVHGYAKTYLKLPKRWYNLSLKGFKYRYKNQQDHLPLADFLL